MRETIIKKIYGQSDVIEMPKIFISITNDIASSLLLSKLITNASDNWFAITQKELERELRLTRRKLERAQKILKSFGLIEVKVKKFNGNAITHYKINYQTLVNTIQSAIIDKQKQLTE